MNQLKKRDVKGIGVAKCFPKNPKYFTEENFSQVFTLPCQKPDIESILSVNADVNIISIRLVDTPKGLSNEGQNLSGCKAVIEIKILYKIKYVANLITQPVHAAHFENVIRSIFIIVPCEVNGECIKDLFKRNKVVVTPYIEDIYFKAIDLRKIYTNITLFLDFVIK